MEINNDNYKQVLLQYLENELNAAEKAKAEQYIRENEDAAYEWKLLKRTRLSPEPKMIFPNKQLLFRAEEEVAETRKPVIMIRMFRYSAIAVAAAILTFAVIIYVNRTQVQDTAQSGIKNNTEQQTGTGTNENKTAYNGPDPKKQPGSNYDVKTKKDSPKENPKVKKGIEKKENKAPVKQQPEEHRSIIIVNQPVIKEQVAEKNTPTGVKTETPGNTENEINTGNNDKTVALNKTTTKKVNKEEANRKTLAGNFIDFLNQVSLKKKKVNDKTYYALSIETPNIKINKTFKSLIQE